MILKEFEISDFQSIHYSEPVKTGDITCLVGKNEAGKTSLLQALYRLNPIIEPDGNYDVTNDYPRKDTEDYIQEVNSGSREHAIVTKVTYTLRKADIAGIQEEFGKGILNNPELILTKGYENKVVPYIDINQEGALKFLIKRIKFSAAVSSSLLKCSSNTPSLIEALEKQKEKKGIPELIELLNKIQDQGSFENYIYQTHLKHKVPKFLYFDEYYQMEGHANIEALIERKENDKLDHRDYPLLGLIELACIKLKDLIHTDSTRTLKNKLESAGNHLTRKIIPYWSQNKHLQIKFDVRPAQPGDPAGMTNGANLWGDVYDTKHMVTTELGSRSRGFVWFFSFLALYSLLRKEDSPFILLLDEPGLFLHAKAQEDLLRYFEKELKPRHQVIYTTHSPFMVDPRRFDRVRIVEDKSIDTDDELLPEKDGTKVLVDILEASDDSLFPLRGALGHEINQTLFIGPNSLVVEGVSDLLYLQTMSSILEKKGKNCLDAQWTITPVGGSVKVPTFVSLIGVQTKLNVAVLVDIQKKDLQMVEDIYRKELLEKDQILTFADFTHTKEADIEDMFDTEFYLKLVNGAFSSVLTKRITKKGIDGNVPRIIVRLEEYFETKLMKKGSVFNHYEPARHFTDNITSLRSHISQETIERFEALFNTLNALL